MNEERGSAGPNAEQVSGGASADPSSIPAQMASAESGPGHAASAWRHARSHARLWMMAAIGLALDLWTKHLAFTRLDLDPAAESGVVIPNIMAFRRSLNPGALFGLGKGLVPIFILASILALGFVLYLFMHSTRERRSLHVGLGLVLAGALGNLYDRTFVIADVVKAPDRGRMHHAAGKIVHESETHIWVLEGAFEAPTDPNGRPKITHTRRIPKENAEIRRQGVVRDFIKMEPRIGSFQVWPWVFNLADAWLVIGVGLLMLNFWWDRKAEQQHAAAANTASQPS